MPQTAAIAEGAPVAEPDAIPSLSSSLLARPASAGDVGNQDGDLLCRKGAATATRSRAYDHKDAFEPAQAAVAPPSDADALGSWLKYEGSVVASEDRAAAVLDEERPTSWFKYETKPMASLLDSAETLLRKPAITLAGADRSMVAAQTEPATDAPSDHQSQTAEAPPAQGAIPEVSSAITAAAGDVPRVDAQLEIEIATAMAEEGAADAPEAAWLPPIPETPQIAITTGALASIENQPDEPLHSAQDPSVDIAEASTPVPSIQECANREQDVDAPIETSSASFDDTISMPVSAPEVEQLFAADAAPLTEQAPTDAPDTSEGAVPATASEVRLGQSDLIRAIETPIEALTPISEMAAPTDDATPMVREQETAPAAVVEVTVRNPAKKAILARLAAMLEQALATKHIANTPENSHLAPALDLSDAPSGTVEQPLLMEVSGAADAELLSAQLPDVTAPAPETAQTTETTSPLFSPELTEALWSALPDPQASAEGLGARAIEPTDMPAEDSAPEIAMSPIELDAPGFLQSNGEGAPEAAAVAAVESDSALAGTLAEPEELEPVLDPIGDEPAAEPPSGQIDQTVTAAPEPSDNPELPIDAPAPGTPPARKRVVLARLFGMLEQALSRKALRGATREPLRSAEPHEPVPAPASIEMAPAADEVPMNMSAQLAPEPIEADESSAIGEAVEPVARQAFAPEPVDIEVTETTVETEPSVNLPIPSEAGASVEAEAVGVEGTQPPPESEISADEQEPALMNASSELSAPERETAELAETNLESEQSVSAPVPPQIGSSMAPDAVEARTEQQPADDETRAGEKEPVLTNVSSEVSAPERMSTELPETNLEPEHSVSAPVSSEIGSSMAAEAIEANAEQRPPDDETRAGEQEVTLTNASAEVSAPEQVATELAETNLESGQSIIAPVSPEAGSSMETEAVDAAAAQPPPVDQTRIVEQEPVLTSGSPDVSVPGWVTTELAKTNIESEWGVSAPLPSEIGSSIATETVEADAARQTSDDVTGADDQPIQTEEPSVVPVESISVPDFQAPSEAPIAGREVFCAGMNDEPRAPTAPSAPAEIGPKLEPQIPTTSTGLLASTPADTGALVPEAAAVVPASEDPAPVVDPPAEEPPPAAVSRVDQEKAARQALTNDLADIIQNVLSTTQFATKAMKPGRYTHAQMLLETEPTDLEGELAPDALPHPVAIRSRLGRMERLLAFASVGMMIAGGYFAFSMWSGEGTVAAPAAVIAAPAASPDPWGERTRDMAREFGNTAVVTDMSVGPGTARQGGTNPAGQQPRTN